MQIKRLAALSLAAIFTAAMLTGCDLLAWLAWLEENSDSSSVTSSPSSSSSVSRPSYDDEDDDTGNTGDTGGEDTETPNPNDHTTWTITSDGKLTVPAGTTTIPAGAFGDRTDITSLDLPEGLTSIGNDAFWSTGLTSVYLPDKLTSIGASAFSECTGLTSIRVGTGIMNANATIDNGAFDGVPDDVIIYYPSELETNLEALKEKLKNAGLDTENYEPETEMLQTAPAAPGGVKELLDTARLFGL